MDYKNLIPAPIDDKNITTDWIEEIFDGQCAVSNGKSYLGYINGHAVKCDIVGNSLHWEFIYTEWGDVSQSNIDIPMKMLKNRLKAKDELDEENRIHVTYMIGGKTCNNRILTQSFYWNNED